jgi:LysR family carnitine catabolism transcriptional activator
VGILRLDHAQLSTAAQALLNTLRAAYNVI